MASSVTVPTLAGHAVARGAVAYLFVAEVPGAGPRHGGLPGCVQDPSSGERDRVQRLAGGVEPVVTAWEKVTALPVAQVPERERGTARGLPGCCSQEHG